MTTARLALLIPLLPGLALSQPTPSLSSPSKIGNAPAVTRQATHIEAKGFLGVIGQNITPHATLKNNSTGAPIAGKKLTFTIRGHGAGAASATRFT